MMIEIPVDHSDRQKYFEGIGVPELLLVEGKRINARLLSGASMGDAIVIHRGTCRTIWEAIVYLLNSSQ